MRAVIDLWVAGTVFDPMLRDAIAGDLIEEHAALVETRGQFLAAVWTSRQLVVSTPGFATLSRTGGIGCRGLDFGLALRFYSVLAFLVACALALALLFVVARDASVDTGVVALSFIGSLVASGGGGFLAAMAARRAPIVGAVALVTMCLGISIGATLVNEPQALHASHAPQWYWAALLLSVGPAVVAGALLRVHWNAMSS